MERKNKIGVRLLKANIIEDGGMPLVRPVFNNWITFITMMNMLRPYRLWNSAEILALTKTGKPELAFEQVNEFLKSITPKGFRFGIKYETLGFWKI